ncbi:MAG: DUF998 domain-containing protein [Promethearchaeota archaeon]
MNIIEKFFRSLVSFINQFFDLIFSFIPAYVFALISVVFAFGTFILSIILYSLGEPFDFFSVYISNLAVSAHSSGIIFGIGMSLSVVSLIPFIYAILKWLWGNSKRGNFFLVLFIIFGIDVIGGFFVVIFFDMQSALVQHDLGSAVFFVSALLMSISLTLAMEVNGKASTSQWVFTTVLITLGIVFIPSYLYTFNSLMYPDKLFSQLTFEDWVIMMGSMDPKMGNVRYFEWIGAISALMWLVQTSFHYKKHCHDIKHHNILKIPYLRYNKERDEEKAKKEHLNGELREEEIEEDKEKSYEMEENKLIELEKSKPMDLDEKEIVKVN